MIYTDTMGQRKAIMEDRAEAFVVAPGGIGTYEEFFEVLTLKQLSEMAAVYLPQKTIQDTLKELEQL